MKNVLYIGNALSNKGRTSTTIETLSLRLREFCSVKIASSKSNKIIRLLDMVFLVLKNKSHTDYVLIDTYSTSNFYYALVISQLCRLFKLKYITILHGGNLERRLIHYPKFSGLIFKNAYKLVAPSHFLKAIFEANGYKKIEYIPNFIDISRYKFEMRSVEKIKLLWVRSFTKIYNPELAILVLEQLIQKGFRASLTMVGPDIDGTLGNVKNLVKTKKLDVVFTGKLTKPEWIKLSQNCNMFINTTNFDNTPVSVIEAMALGLPVISTEVGGMPFLISNNEDGLLVPAKKVQAMSEAIIKLQLDTKLRTELVHNARCKVENFDWKIVKPKWQRLLK